VPAAAPPAETAAPRKGERGVGGKAEGAVVPECCGQVLEVLGVELVVWEARCDRCGSEYGLPPSQQSAALLAAQAGMELESV
jgi:hypothetical protein